MTTMQAFRYEYTHQRWLGRGVIVSTWLALQYALQPLPF
jgi:hypothetical protein